MSKGEAKNCKMFVGGLHVMTDNDSLKEYFSKWGEVTDAIVMKEGTKSRGFGFVTYEDPKSVEDCLNNKPHELDGREIEAKYAVPKEDMSPSSRARTKKIFLGGLSPQTTEEDIANKLKEMGAQNPEVKIMTDRNTEKPRGFGFAILEDFDIVDKICVEKYITILDREVEVKKAKSQDELKKYDSRPASRPYPSGNYSYPGGREMMYPPRANMYDMGRMPQGYDYSAYDDYLRTAREYQGMSGYSMPAGYDRTAAAAAGYSYGATRGTGYDMTSSPYSSMYNTGMMGTYTHGASSYGPTRGYTDYRERGERGDSKSSSYHPYRR